jgi:BioD-like phosphotransacetylase family protein
MAASNATSLFQSDALLITPGDSDDLIAAAATPGHPKLAGIVLTGNLRPGGSVLKMIQSMSFPVLLAREDSYHVASTVHDLTVKTRPDDTEKISLIRDLIAEYVDVNKILKAL